MTDRIPAPPRKSRIATGAIRCSTDGDQQLHHPLLACTLLILRAISVQPADAQELIPTQQPDGSAWSMDSYRHQNASGGLSGGLKELILPAGGALRWTYRGYIFHAQEPSSNPGTNLNVNLDMGTKSVFEKATDASPIGVWTYTPSFDLSITAPGDEGGLEWDPSRVL